jgi:hypothetical protein
LCCKKKNTPPNPVPEGKKHPHGGSERTRLNACRSNRTRSDARI